MLPFEFGIAGAGLKTRNFGEKQECLGNAGDLLLIVACQFRMLSDSKWRATECYLLAAKCYLSLSPPRVQLGTDLLRDALVCAHESAENDEPKGRLSRIWLLLGEGGMGELPRGAVPFDLSFLDEFVNSTLKDLQPYLELELTPQRKFAPLSWFRSLPQRPSQREPQP